MLRVPAGTGGAPIRVHFKNRTGYDRWADIGDVTVLVRLDGAVVSSVPGAYCSEHVLTPEETEKAIEFLNQEKGEQPI